MDENIVVRPYEPGDKDQIVQLLNLVFQGWPHFNIKGTSLDHWTWKFEQNPTRKYNVIVGEVDKKIIACDHGFYTTAMVGGKAALCRQGVDSAVHPDYRGRGIYHNMDRQKDEKDSINKVKLVYSVTTNPILVNRESKKDQVRPHYITDLSRLIRISDVDVFVNNLKSKSSFNKISLKYMIKAAKTLNSAHILSHNAKKINSASVKIKTVEKFDESVNLLWEKIKDDYCFMVERTAEYLNWRYLDPRGGNYIVKQAEENEAVIGFIVFGINSFDIQNPRGYIIDLCTLADRPDCAQLLISDALNFFNESKINTVECWVSKGHYYGSLFEKFGFVDEKSDVQLSFNTDKIEALKPLMDSKPGQILFQLGDADWI
jgi:hypothetical protein